MEKNINGKNLKGLWCVSLN